MASYRLAIQFPGQAPQVREFSAPRIVIGRESGDLVLPDPRCSSTHAELLFDGTYVRLRDLGSSNGTWSQGQRLSELVLQPGASFQIGQISITLHEVRQDAGARGQTMVDSSFQMPPPGGANPLSPTVYGNPQGAPYGSAPGGFSGGPSGPNYGQPQGQAPAPQGYGQPNLARGPQYAQAPYGQQPGPFPPRPQPKSGGFKAWWLLLPVSLIGMCGVGMGAIGYWGAKGAQQGSATGGDLPTLTEPRETNVQFVWFSGSPGPTAKGGTAKARIRVAPNKSGTVSVGVFEEFAGGGGNQWKTATWLAAFNAARTTNTTLSDYEFAVHVGGYTDGPSAGMLTTVSMLALLRGKTLREDSTMTGTINPDGSAGPVGGIVQKIEGAKATGLKRFGFPIGCRNHKDMKTGKDVDLVSFGSGQGLEVKEISDLYEGYEFMTGDKLERLEGVADSELEPPSATNDLIRAKTVAWKAKIDREIGNLKQEVKRTGRAVEAAAEMLKSVDESYEKAQRYEKNGFLGPALEAYAQASIELAVASRTTRATYLMMQGSVTSLLEELSAAQKTTAEVDAFGAQLEIKGQSQTRGGQIRTISAFTTYVNAKSATMIGDDFSDQAANLLKAFQEKKVEITDESASILMARIAMPAIFYDVARVYLDYSKDLQDLIADEGSSAPMSATTIDRTVGGYASASTAVLEYFDALIVDEIAKEKGVSKDEVQYKVAQKEPEYYLARKASILSMKNDKATSDGAKMMRLAAASVAYLGGAKLVNKFYSLNGHFDDKGAFVLENRKALSAQLDLAKRTARESAARSTKIAGFIPTPAKLAFQHAAALREGTDEEKLQALAWYWSSSLWSELAAQK